MLVTNAKLKMREEFEHKKKELQVQMLMCVGVVASGAFLLFETLPVVLLACLHGKVYAVRVFQRFPARRPRASANSAAASSSPVTS
jgi:hypothetical protein